MKNAFIQQITCEQLYRLWSTEPDLIQLFDLRSQDEFKVSHIPGSKNLTPTDLFFHLKNIGNKLAILIANLNQPTQFDSDFEMHKKFVMLSFWQHWHQAGFPIANEGADQTEKNFSKILSKGAAVNSEIQVHQLFESSSSTYTYIVADKFSKEAVIIDPVLDTIERDIKYLKELNLKLLYALDTHIHADHITGAGELRKRLGIKSAVSSSAQVTCVDIPLEDGQEILIGNKVLKVIATPGHTDTCLTFAIEGLIFTGDALLIRGCGRTDFQNGDSQKLYQSVREKLFKLPDETIIYPAHDYKGLTSSTIGEEKKYNARLNESISLDEFVKIMSALKLDKPKKIQEAVPANLACGIKKESFHFNSYLSNGIPEISVESLFNDLEKIKEHKVQLIDVRRPDEFNNELGHIEGAKLVTLGLELTTYLESLNRSSEIVFICRSGARSGAATTESINLGFKNTVNMTGGMLMWNEKQQPIVRFEEKK